MKAEKNAESDTNKVTEILLQRWLLVQKLSNINFAVGKC